MKQLRPLKAGFCYKVTRMGAVYVERDPWEINQTWSSDDAPAACFADAKPEEPLREGERVVVVDNPLGCDKTYPADGCWAGRHGTIEKLEVRIAWVRFDSSGVFGIWDHNLRRERADERPAADITSHSCTRAKEPEPVIGCKLLRADGGSLVGHQGCRLFYPVGNRWIEDWQGMGIFVAVEGGLEAAVAESEAGDFVAAFECLESIHTWTSHGIQTFRRVRRLPEIPMDRLYPYLREEVEAWQAKHEPKPEPPKFALGQWVEWGVNRVRVKSAHYIKPSWEYILDGCFHHPQEEELTPCPPLLSDAMKLLCWPGNRVRVIEHPAGDDGAPLSKGGVEKYSNARIGVRLLGRAGVVEGVGNMVGVVLDRHSDSEAAYEAAGRASRSPHPITGPHALIVRCWPWNLEPAEEK